MLELANSIGVAKVRIFEGEWIVLTFEEVLVMARKFNLQSL